MVISPSLSAVSREQWQKIKAVVLDIDGVLTDGRLGYDGGTQEIKFFHVRDGQGLRLALRAGLKVGALSGREAGANRRRAEELGFTFLYEKIHNKTEGFQQLLHDQQLQPEECLYVGDEVVDVPVMHRAGIGIAVADAPEYVQREADAVTALPGGCGAIREVIDFLLKAQNRWNELMQRYEVQS